MPQNPSPPPASGSGRRPGFFRRLVTGYVSLSYRAPWIPLLVVAISALGAFQLAKGLRIHTDLRVLLPEGTPSKVALEEAERRKGSTDFYTVAFQHPDPAVVARFQRDLADSLDKWDEVEWVQFDQDRTFFEKRALLYLPVSELEDLRDRVSGMIGDEFVSANPLLTDLGLDDEEEEPQGLEGWPNPDALRRQGLPEDIVKALLSRVEGRQTVKQDRAGESTSPEAAPEAPTLPDSLDSRLMGWHAGREMWVGAVLSQLNRPSTDALFAKALFEKGEALIARMEPASYAPDLDAKVVGAYRNFSEIEQVNQDVVLAGSISLALMTLLLWFFVRKPVNLLLINVPLFVAMAWAMGATYLVFQRLTLLTAFILALILGLGIEYTVHLYSRWAEESRKGNSPVDAMAQAMLQSGRALLAGAATNIMAMLSLQVGHFQGFREFGVVVSIGITFSLLATWLVVPPLFFAAQKGSARIRAIPGLGFAASWLLPGSRGIEGGTLLPTLPLTRRVAVGLGAGAAVFTLALCFAPGVGFENDFRNLRGESTGAGISYGRAVGAGKNTSPSIILGESEAQMRSVHDSLMSRYGNPADSMLKSYATVQSFVPKKSDQLDRLEVLEEIEDLLNSRALERVDSAQRADLDLLRNYVGVQRFTFDSLPAWAQRYLTEADGSTGKLGYLYGNLLESDAVESGKFQDRFQWLPADSGKVLVASSGFIYSDVVRMVKEDGPKLALVTLLLLIVITWLDMRSWRGVLAVVGFIVLSGFWTYKVMGLLGLKLGMFNLVVLPTILSVSVDSVIHLYHRRRALGAGKLPELYKTTGSAVLTGTLNNLFGFLGLCFVTHKGMQTIGFLATLGIGSGLVVMFTALPIALELLCPKEPQAEEA